MCCWLMIGEVIQGATKKGVVIEGIVEKDYAGIADSLKSSPRRLQNPQGSVRPICRFCWQRKGYFPDWLHIEPSVVRYFWLLDRPCLRSSDYCLKSSMNKGRNRRFVSDAGDLRSDNLGQWLPDQEMPRNGCFDRGMSRLFAALCHRMRQREGAVCCAFRRIRLVNDWPPRLNPKKMESQSSADLNRDR